MACLVSPQDAGSSFMPCTSSALSAAMCAFVLTQSVCMCMVRLVYPGLVSNMVVPLRAFCCGFLSRPRLSLPGVLLFCYIGSACTQAPLMDATTGPNAAAGAEANPFASLFQPAGAAQPAGGATPSSGTTSRQAGTSQVSFGAMFELTSGFHFLSTHHSSCFHLT